MAGTANAYGQINPQLVDPYPIETTLAGMAADPQKQGIGVPLLALYRSDRGLQAAQGAEELQKQHQFSRDRLQAEIAKNIADATTAAAKEPGALELLNAPGGGYAGQLDQGVMARAIQRQNMQANAAQMKTVLEGYKAGAEGGITPSAGDTSALAGVNLTPQDPTTTTNAKIAANARIAAASIGAAGGGKVYSSILVKDANGNPTTIRVPVNEGDIPGSVQRQQNIVQGYTAAGAPPVQTDQGKVPSTNQTQVDQGVRNSASLFVNRMDKNSPEYKAVIRNGGTPIPQKLPNGKWGVVGMRPDGTRVGIEFDPAQYR